MTEYKLAVGFYVHGHITKIFEAESDEAAITKAKEIAAEVMEGGEYPDSIDHEEKYTGIIGYVDRFTGDNVDEIASNIPLGHPHVPELHKTLSKLIEAITEWPQFDTDTEVNDGEQCSRPIDVLPFSAEQSPSTPACGRTAGIWSYVKPEAGFSTTAVHGLAALGRPGAENEWVRSTRGREGSGFDQPFVQS